MCGVGFISLSPESKLHPRKLANALLLRLEDRGYMASGWAYGRDDATPRYHKGAFLGGQLDVSRIPANTRNVILHTRLSTHGSEKDNRNNHPVLSPDKNIALVHNGVLWNHDDVRKIMPEFELPEVDTSVAPALLQKFGVKGLAKIAGDAALAWFATDTGRTIHLARQEHSPMVMAKLSDGSIVGASTGDILGKALMEFPEVSVLYGYAMEELEYYQILDGMVTKEQTLTKPVGFAKAYASSYRGMTSGKTSSVWDEYLHAEEIDDYDGFKDAVDDWEDPDFDMWDYEMRKATEKYSINNFYVTDYYGNDTNFYSLGDLLDHLKWYATQDPGEAFWPHLEDESAWVNWFCDIGEVAANGTQTSWLRFPEDIQDHALDSWVKDGVDLLKRFE